MIDISTLFVTRPSACPSGMKLDAFSTGHADPGEREVIEQHVAECQSCRELLFHQRSAFEAIGGAGHDAILKRITQASIPRSSSGVQSFANLRASRTQGMRLVDVFRGRWLYVGAAAVVLLGIFVVPFRPLDTPANDSRKGGVPETRFKGTASAVRFEVFRQRQGQVQLLQPGAEVRPGDHLRFRVTSPPGYWMIVARVQQPGSGADSYPLYPSTDIHTTAERSSGARERVLPGAVELDHTSGAEAWVFVNCEKPFRFEELQWRGNVLEYPLGCLTHDLPVMKRPQTVEPLSP